jgi:23S rRNA (adenine1618-N6)-methyltransferase
LKKYHKIPKKIAAPQPKAPGLHPRNTHQGRYDLDALSNTLPELLNFIVKTDFGDTSIDFFNPEAVKNLNKAILFKDYNIKYWNIPKGYLCPPIPGRADYIHFLADVLNELPQKDTLIHPNFKCLDIGTGANLIYPIIGQSAYKWKFIATDIDQIALDNANEILQKNAELSEDIELKLQENKNVFFKGIVNTDDFFEANICNPPFHSSQEEASAGTLRKLKNLKAEVVQEDALNFGGQNNELIYEGGELKFIQDMAKESTKFNKNILWFSSLVSKSAHIHILQRFLSEIGVAEQRTIEMGQGNKTSRFIAWTFFSKSERLKHLEGKKIQNDPN